MKNYLFFAIALCSMHPTYSMYRLFSYITQGKSTEATQIETIIHNQKDKRIEEGNQIAEIQNFLPFQSDAEKIDSYGRIVEILERQLAEDILSHKKASFKEQQITLTKKMIEFLQDNT